MNLSLWLKKAKEKIDSIDAELILLLVLEKEERSFLVSHDDLVLTKRDLLLLNKLVDLRKQGMPMAYLAGKKEFYGRKFCVNQHVLIPRPESEDVIDLAKKMDRLGKLGRKKILDVGTGSGCLAITLALEIQNSKVMAVDISKAALHVAAKNAIEMNAKVCFAQSDLLKNVKEKFNLIVANLPYVDITWPWCNREISWEPGLALYARDDGLELIKKILVQAKTRTRYLILEADPCQHDTIVAYGSGNGYKLIEKLGYQLLFEI